MSEADSDGGCGCNTVLLLLILLAILGVIRYDGQKPTPPQTQMKAK